MLKKILGIAVLFGAMFGAISSPALARMRVAQLSSGADGFVRYQVMSTGLSPTTSAAGFVLVVRERVSASNAPDFAPIAAVNSIDCGLTEADGACYSLGLELTDADGQPSFFGTPLVPNQAVGITLAPRELCREGALQTGGLPEGCAVDSASPTGYAQTAPMRLIFQVYALPTATSVDAPVTGNPVDSTKDVFLSPATAPLRR